MFSHLSHNYMLGVGILIFAFIFFYTPMVYAFLKSVNNSVSKISCRDDGPKAQNLVIHR